MGKNQHSKDRLFVTRTEQEQLYGGKRGLSSRETGAALSAAKAAELPLTHCALSLQPWDNPVCTPDGTVFELLNLFPYVRKYGVHPISGEPLSTAEIVKLVFHKNSEGEIHCPILFKTFNKNSHVVAVKTTGNVYSYDAVKELNLKPRSMKDLLTGEPFVKKDILTLADKNNLSLRRIADSKVRQRAMEERKKSGASVRLDSTATRALDEASKNNELVEKNSQLKLSSESTRKFAEKTDSGKQSNIHTTGRAAAGFTSTALNPVTENELRALTEDEVREERYKQVKEKGYVTIMTNHGPLNVELHCDQTPRTCENFLGLAGKGFYNGVLFHRSIPRFVLQGGDPTGTGRGGESLWGSPFEDEIRGSLKHKGKGMLSMANSGPNSNTSQFFITYASAPHLDGKHTVFGQVVGAVKTLEEIEKVPTDDDDRPKEDVRIDSVKVLVNPFTETVRAKQKEQREEEEKQAKLSREKKRDQMYAKAAAKEGTDVVGKYVGKVSGGEVDDVQIGGIPQPKKPKLRQKSSSSFGDFSRW
eukprot:CAMPEP_0113961670 /NCGR_PEP_ID=MMETSP0011_2-20120614/5455_1 /TAXON_ID=101924 /ORGANISM="Rhodosorus marinus" /LENGTH=530 /DNA_ID=CAMNT_0000973371 /DNA_START=723 /DNA_END=2312 /DNA_ORIENTATION=- /assembly_acc=CAM_ASM_000156